VFPTRRSVFSTVTSQSASRRGFELDIGCVDHLRIVTTSNYNSPTAPHTSNITVTAAHIKSLVFIRRFLATGFNRVIVRISLNHTLQYPESLESLHGSVYRLAHSHENSCKMIRCHDNVSSGSCPNSGWTRSVQFSFMLRPTVSRPVCLGIKHPFRAYDQICINRMTIAFFLLWGALSDERTGLTFIYAAGPCQRNLSLLRAPWVSRPYFTVSYLRLPFSSPPTTRRVTVEVFDPASTRGCTCYIVFWVSHELNIYMEHLQLLTFHIVFLQDLVPSSEKKKALTYTVRSHFVRGVPEHLA
jgi:hypothetical protein